MKTRKWKLVNDTVTVAHGDDATLTFSVELDSDGSVVDLTTNHTATFAIRTSDTSNTDVITPITESGMTLNADGTITMALSSAVTSTIPVGTYVYELELKQTTPAYVETVSRGVFKVTPSIAGVGAPV